MGEIQEIINFITNLIQPIWNEFPIESIPWIIAGVSAYFLIAKMKQTWDTVFKPIFYKKEDIRRRNRRRRFSKYIADEIIRLNRLEDWSDYKYTELEAEVEAEGRWKSKIFLSPIRKKRSGLRRESSLSKALRKSSETLILLEGSPGAGKSVALRHLTQKLAEKASKARSNKSIIPIYINLRGLNKAPEESIDRQLIHDYINKVLRRVNDRDVDTFLDDEFHKGMQENTWLFLFDSFDEIPDVLSSTEADEMIWQYSSAIADFMSGMNTCRAVVASRQFHGPLQKNWPRFRILPLTEKQKTQLIKKAELPVEKERLLFGSLPNAGMSIQNMSSNPMFLGLLCEHLLTENKFPQNIHATFEKYISTRFTVDTERLTKSFKLHPSEVRFLAEKIAFSMTADQSIGLSPTRKVLIDSIENQGYKTTNNIHSILDALEYLKLARSETPNLSGSQRLFTFSHRRFQEYFATCIVLQEPTRISNINLITNARWREACVTILQIQPSKIINPILSEAEKILCQEYKNYDVDKHTHDNLMPSYNPWPRKILHILNLLQEGLYSHIQSIPSTLRLIIDDWVSLPNQNGILLDRKKALEVAGIATDNVINSLIINALESGSQWLRNVAYQQLGKVRKTSMEIDKAVRDMLLSLVFSRRFMQERFATFTQLSRLPNAKHFLDIFNLLLFTLYADIVSIAIFLIWFIIEITLSNSSGIFPSSFFLVLVLLSQVTLKSDRHYSFPYFMLFMRLFLGSMILFAFLVTLVPLNVYSTWLLLIAYAVAWTPSTLFLIMKTGKYGKRTYWPWTPFILILEHIIKPLNKRFQIRKKNILTSFLKNTFLVFISFLVSIPSPIMAKQAAVWQSEWN